MKLSPGPWIACAAVWTLVSCATVPTPRHRWTEFPENAWVEEPGPSETTQKKRKFDVIKTVRAKVNFPTFDPEHSEDKLCRNYFNRAVEKLVREAKDAGGEAVIHVRSVVFLMDGKSESYPRAECVDEGDEGQVLVKGDAIRWVPLPESD